MGDFIAYYRVSTDKQGRSGLGLEAQKRQVHDFISSTEGRISAEYIEVESAKDDERPVLAKAIRQSKLTGQKLIIAKLDRLSRSLHYITSLAESKVDFVVCDLPGCDQFTINLYGALAQRERELISSRTKSALEAAKARGITLGMPQNLNKAAAERGRKLGVQARKKNADEFARNVSPVIQGYIAKGMSLNQVARELNRTNILTARGKQGSWTPSAVKNVLNRLQSIEE